MGSRSGGIIGSRHSWLWGSVVLLLRIPHTGHFIETHCSVVAHECVTHCRLDNPICDEQAKHNAGEIAKDEKNNGAFDDCSLDYLNTIRVSPHGARTTALIHIRGIPRTGDHRCRQPRAVLSTSGTWGSRKGPRIHHCPKLAKSPPTRQLVRGHRWHGDKHRDSSSYMPRARAAGVPRWDAFIPWAFRNSYTPAPSGRVGQAAMNSRRATRNRRPASRRRHIRRSGPVRTTPSESTGVGPSVTTNAAQLPHARESGIRDDDATTLRLATISPPSLSCSLRPCCDQRRHRVALLIR